MYVVMVIMYLCTFSVFSSMFLVLKYNMVRKLENTIGTAVLYPRRTYKNDDKFRKASF